MKFRDTLKHAWSIFLNRDPTKNRYLEEPYNAYYGPASYSRPQSIINYLITNEKSIKTSIFNKISVDVASYPIRHVRLDDDDNYKETIDSCLNECLSTSANIDQTGRALIQDVAASLFDEGVIALVPIETSINPKEGAFDILSLRTGKIIQWYPRHVQVSLYDDRTGKREDVTIEKEKVAIIENPFYNIMNEKNSTLQRLSRKLSLLDNVDENNASGKLNMLIQLPYVVKSEARKEQAELRTTNLGEQLKTSEYGIAYVDGSEKIVQLNRPLDNSLMAQVTYLTSLLFNQLGLTENVFNGTADEKEMLNYFSRTIEPALSAITDAIKRSFLTKTARTQKQSIMFFKNIFALMPSNNIADIADKFTRNEILTSNEFRSIIGFKPSSDPRANELKNKNIAAPTQKPEMEKEVNTVNEVVKDED